MADTGNYFIDQGVEWINGKLDPTQGYYDAIDNNMSLSEAIHVLNDDSSTDEQKIVAQGIIFKSALSNGSNIDNNYTGNMWNSYEDVFSTAYEQRVKLRIKYTLMYGEEGTNTGGRSAFDPYSDAYETYMSEQGNWDEMTNEIYDNMLSSYEEKRQEVVEKHVPENYWESLKYIMFEDPNRVTITGKRPGEYDIPIGFTGYYQWILSGGYGEYIYDKMHKKDPSEDVTSTTTVIDNDTKPGVTDTGTTIEDVSAGTGTKDNGDTINENIKNTDPVDPATRLRRLLTLKPAYDNAKAAVMPVDPLVLDLDGHGLDISKKVDGANFDLDKNGFAERMNWTKTDGFLCLDLNENGKIDDGGELFGDQTALADGTNARDGFEALAQYDKNGDGVIDANDEIFSELRVWVDAA